MAERKKETHREKVKYMNERIKYLSVSLDRERTRSTDYKDNVDELLKANKKLQDELLGEHAWLKSLVSSQFAKPVTLVDKDGRENKTWVTPPRISNAEHWPIPHNGR